MMKPFSEGGESPRHLYFLIQTGKGLGRWFTVK